MKNLKIKAKLFVTFAIILILFFITVMAAIFGLRTMSKSFRDFYTNSYPVSYGALEMCRATQSAIKNVLMVMLTEDLEQKQTYIQEAAVEFESVAESITYLQENFRGDKSILEKTLAKLQESKPYRIQILELAANNQNDEAEKILFENYQPLMFEVQSYIMQADSATVENAENDFSASNRLQTFLLTAMISISVTALILTIILAIYITNRLTRPIKEIELAADKLSAGDLNAAVTYTSKDELGSLSNSIRILITALHSIIGDVGFLLDEMASGNFMVKSKNPNGYVGDFAVLLQSMRKLRDRLCSVLSQINRSADQVSSGSDQVASGAQALSQGTTEQASSVEELAATINEISGQVNATASNANAARCLVDHTGEQLASSNQQMREMTIAMTEISQKSEEIGKIIKTIEDIAFQTNILALNAAVEAARVGVAGKGFTVVADEVRNLASKSSKASKSTAVLLGDTIQAVEKGVHIAAAAEESLLVVAKSAKEVIFSVDRIALAAEQQANSITQVKQGIDQISSVVQTNSATSEESAASSEELSGQAQTLKDLVSQFKLNQ